MSRIWKVIITIFFIIIAIIGAVLIFHAQNNRINKEADEDKSNTSQETELMPEIKTKKEYTGYCAIYGKYRNRYVECIGDYDPEAKARAEEKAKECNESDKAVHGCTDRYQ